MKKTLNLKNKLIYLASPYSHSDPKVMENRFLEITKLAGHLIIDKKLAVLTPITASHELAKICGIKGSWKQWRQVDIPQVKKSDILLVALMSGWRESVGVKAEIRLAKKMKKPVLYFDPYTLEILEDWRCLKNKK